MHATILILTASHLVADFLLQTEWIVRRKKRPVVLLLHIGIVGLVTVLLLGSAPILLLALLLFSHTLLDALKTYVLSGTVRSFLLDQAAHLAVIVILSFLYPDAAPNGFWLTFLVPEAQQVFLKAVTLLGGVALCVPAGGVTIGLATGPLLEEIRSARRATAMAGTGDVRLTGEEMEEEPDYGVEGLRRGGRYIGWLERALIMLLLLMNQSSSVGFLFAAKSILRYGDIKNTQQRRVAEYIIIGTLMSFGWGLLATFITMQTLALW